MTTLQPHAAFARPMDQLDVVVIDDSKAMQSIVRSMLNSFKVARVRTYDGPQAALDSIHVDPPHLLVVDWLMEPIDGLSMLKAMRARRMGALATVPAIILTSAPTRRLVEASLRVSAHAVLAKPLSPMVLQKRIRSIVNDNRNFSLDDETDSWMLDGASELFAAQQSRQQRYTRVRDEYIEAAKREIASVLPIEAKPKAAAPATPADIGPTKTAGMGAIPKSTTFGAIVEDGESDKPRPPRKAIGITGRRLATPPVPPTRHV